MPRRLPETDPNDKAHRALVKGQLATATVHAGAPAAARALAALVRLAAANPASNMRPRPTGIFRGLAAPSLSRPQIPSASCHSAVLKK